MRVVIQRVSNASVSISETSERKIGKGLVVFLGIQSKDNRDDIHYLIKKIVALRIFSDEAGKMNLSIQDIRGELLVISQFTLFAQTKKGNRPSFVEAAIPDLALPLYHDFLENLMQQCHGRVIAGEFGTDMQVTLCNDGPVTIIMDTHAK